jgi:hypothetical protein
VRHGAVIIARVVACVNTSAPIARLVLPAKATVVGHCDSFWQFTKPEALKTPIFSAFYELVINVLFGTPEVTLFFSERHMSKTIGILLILAAVAGSALAVPAVAPEIDGSSAVSAVGLLSGALFVIRGRKR